MYWSVFLIALCIMFSEGNSISTLYGKGIEGMLFFVVDFMGLATIFKSTALIGAWYLTTIIIFYVFYPIFYYFVKKLGIIILFLTYLPWICYLVIGNVDMHTDWWGFYLFSFLLGLYLSYKKVLNRLYKINGLKGFFIALINFIIFVILRLYLTLPIDPLLSFSIILLEIFVLSRFNFITGFLKSLGEQSANIWLIHPVIIYTLNSVIFKSNLWKFVLVLFISMGVSMIIEMMKAGLNINKYVIRIRKEFI